ncbi:MAG: hypothetical protein JSS95_11870 [Acidobacteria bacterium]|nr:hypothetical protein [Acidobacteriota bacterium]
MITAQSLSVSRRDFLREAIGLGASASFFGASSSRAFASGTRGSSRKVIIVTFGGGARDDETFSVHGHRNIPCLLNQLAPQSTFFTQVVNRGILGHYVATASIATGAYETFDNFITQRPANPTLFEYFRSGLHRPLEDAWVVAPSRNFTQMSASDHRRFGPDYGAQLVMPKQLLAVALGERFDASSSGYLDLLRDNYEDAAGAAMDSRDRDAAARLIHRLHLDPADLTQRASSLISPDELSIYTARQVMQQFAPSLLFLTLHDIDIAHLGAFSLYLEAIQRTDRLCGELWQTVQSLPEYKDRTTLFILPDFGRDGDGEPGGNGFQHHRTGSALARTTWMMALGPAVRQGVAVQRPVDSLDLVPTVGHILGFDTPFAHGRPIVELA